MLRVGLTGGLGSGKSTVAQMFAARGVNVISADEVGRRLMQPGEAVYRGIVEHFGTEVVLPDGQLDRKKLAEMAFQQGRLDELNRIVHPPVIAEQEKWAEEIFSRGPDAIVMVESALVFEAGASGSVPEWHKRFDRIVLVTAPDEVKIHRFVERLSKGKSVPERQKIEEDARARLAAQIPDSEKIPLSDYVIDNGGPLAETERQVDMVLAQLQVATGLRRA
jgi:dephospho-CoA kinase